MKAKKKRETTLEETYKGLLHYFVDEDFDGKNVFTKENI